MIRQYKNEDYVWIKEILNDSDGMLCAWLTTDEAIKSDLENAKVAYVYEEEGIIKGFTYLDPYEYEPVKRIHFYLFVQPTYWWTGVTEKLWDEMKPHILCDAYRTSIGFPATHTETRLLFKREGFKHYFFSLRLEYNGPQFNDIDLSVRPYENQDFLDYIKTYNEGFYDLRKEHDMLPYLPYDENDENLTKLIIEDESDGLYTFSKDGKIVGFGKIKQFIDEVVVAKEFQGQGYGKQIVKYCTNKLLNKGINPVAIYHLDTNIRARKLYESCGFKVRTVIEALERKRKEENNEYNESIN